MKPTSANLRSRVGDTCFCRAASEWPQESRPRPSQPFFFLPATPERCPSEPEVLLRDGTVPRKGGRVRSGFSGRLTSQVQGPGGGEGSPASLAAANLQLVPRQTAQLLVFVCALLPLKKPHCSRNTHVSAPWDPWHAPMSSPSPRPPLPETSRLDSAGPRAHGGGPRLPSLCLQAPAP